MFGENQGGGRSILPYHLYLPPQLQRPLLVLVHGVSARPARMIEYAAAFAARHGVPLLAPDFSGAEFAGYQRLLSGDGHLGAARALRVAVDEACIRHGLGSTRFDLAGFSGGGQFAHRFAMHFPDAVRRVVVASAGWYTYLDRGGAYPLAVGSGELAPSERDLEAFLQLPILISVGEKDVERGKQLRTSLDIDRRQGMHRFERAHRWFDHLSTEASRRGVRSQAELCVLPNTGHSLKEAVRHGGFITKSFEFFRRSDREAVAQVMGCELVVRSG